MKQAFVSGGTRGIGRKIVLELAKAGYEVGFCYQKSSSEADELLAEISKYTTGFAYCYDLSSVDEVERLARSVLSDLPRLELLVNNAGVSDYGVFQDVTPEKFERVFSVNFKSLFFLTRALLSPMLNQKYGRIINISSIWGQTGASCEVLYSSTKAAVNGFTKALAKELGPSGITVNAIAPGVVDTDMMAQFAKEERIAIQEEIPLGRFADPVEIAHLVAFLASREASYVTGQIMAVNGGMYC